MDLEPTLKNLCIAAVLENSEKLNYKMEFPKSLVTEIDDLAKRNKFSESYRRTKRICQQTRLVSQDA